MKVQILIALVAGISPAFGNISFGIEPTLEDLQRVFRKIDSADDQTKSIEINGSIWVQDGIEFSVALAYRQPSDWLVKICDAADETPVLWLKDRKMLFYAAGDATVYLSEEASHVELKLEKSDDSMAYQAGLGIGKKPSRLVIDPSFVFLNRKSSTIKQIRDQSYECVLVSKRNNAGVAIVDLSQEYALKSLEVRLDGNPKPSLSLKSVKVNQPVSDELFSFPNLGELRSGIKVQTLTIDSQTEAAAMLGRLTESVLIRFGVKKPEVRQKIRDSANVNWDSVQRSDERIAALLRRDVRR